MIGHPKRNMRMVIEDLPKDIGFDGGSSPKAVNDNGVVGGPVMHSVMLCRELQDEDTFLGQSTGNSVLPNEEDIYWMVLVPKHLGPTVTMVGDGFPSQGDLVTPPYALKEIIHCQRLDTPICLNSALLPQANSLKLFNRLQNHGSLSSGTKWAKIVNSKNTHFGQAVDPRSSMIFWFDLNVDGRTRSKQVADAGTSGTSAEGGARNVWL